MCIVTIERQVNMNTKLYRVDPDNIDESIIKKAANVIKNGGVVAFPTETVYGLGGDATNEEAATRIYAAKGRPSDNPLIIHVASPTDAEKYAYTNELYYKLCDSFSPGPLTVILPKKTIVPNTTSGGLDTVAVRIPDNKIALELIKESNCAIAAPSANSSGKPSPTKAKHVLDDLNGKIPMIIDGGECRIGVESTVIKIDDGKCTILRPGGVTKAQLLGVCPCVEFDKGLLEKPSEDFKPLAPGMKYKHYSPTAEVYMVKGDENSVCKFMRKQLGENERIGIICYDDMCISGKYVKYISKDSTMQAHVLFDILRYFDTTDAERIYTVIPNDGELGLAVLNRLTKAAGFKTISV